MGLFVPALNGSCSCPPIGRDLGPCRPDTKLFWAVPCLAHAFFRASGRSIRLDPNVHLQAWPVLDIDSSGGNGA
jgi:hypothetical protein